MFLSEPVSLSGLWAFDILCFTVLEIERDELGWAGPGAWLVLLLLLDASVDRPLPGDVLALYLVPSRSASSSVETLQLLDPSLRSLCASSPVLTLVWFPPASVLDFPKAPLSLATVGLTHRRF